MLTPVVTYLTKRQDSSEVSDRKLKDQNTPVTVFDQKRQLKQKAPTASSQNLCTFLWL
jgi:hypothetical protein